jgi:hypothetical protein
MIGLSGGKHFALLANFRIQNMDYFLLRNPLGKFEFRGNSALPTPQQTQALRSMGFSDLKPGNFLVDAEEIVEQFESYTVAYYQPSYQMYSKQFQCKRNTEIYFRFRVRQSGPICLRIHQVNVNRKSL